MRLYMLTKETTNLDETPTTHYWSFAQNKWKVWDNYSFCHQFTPSKTQVEMVKENNPEGTIETFWAREEKQDVQSGT